MRQIAFIVAISSLAFSASAGEGQNALAKLDAKVAKGLSSERWDYASKAFVRVVWEDYKKAHLYPTEDKSTHSISGTMPDAQSYDQYIGSFGREPDSEDLFVGVTKSEEGRFFVQLEGHTIPAVCRNRCIVFTTGDVVYSSMPRLGEKPYCTIEIYMLILTGEKYYFASPGSSPDKWMELSKLKQEG